MNKGIQKIRDFLEPVLVLAGILAYAVLQWFHYETAAIAVVLAVIIIGSFEMLKETVVDFFHKKFGLDYIAIATIAIGLWSQNFFVTAVIALMLATGRSLEKYGYRRAKESLTKLSKRIPDKVQRWADNRVGEKVSVQTIAVGDKIYIRKGEVVPLDGVLFSNAGLFDESSLTGEPYLFDKIQNDPVRSGTINVGMPAVITVTKEEKDSTYRKIINMVRRAQEEKPPLVRLADRYSIVFTAFTFGLALIVYFATHDIVRVLAVLVIATPCPLILATPIALMGGMNAAAKRRIIVKKLAVLETLSRADAMIFDKTGTITLGKPTVAKIEIHDPSHTREKILAIAEGIERGSLHPFAKAIVAAAKEEHAAVLHASGISEKIGQGITGTVAGKTYNLGKSQASDGMIIEMKENDKLLASFFFDDRLKTDSKHIFEQLRKTDTQISIYTGDKKASAEKIMQQLPPDIILKAECTPEDKKNGIQELKSQGKVTAMVGDGINDAPALALADVGMVFSNEEQTASSEAADIVFLGGDFPLVLDALAIAKRTVRIAKQSILFGIGLSVVGMTFAAFGFIPAVAGATLQEMIDIAVIINALRASRI